LQRAVECASRPSSDCWTEELEQLARAPEHVGTCLGGNDDCAQEAVDRQDVADIVRCSRDSCT